nr:MAG: capsid protein [Cressdnaviricota sp.]
MPNYLPKAQYLALSPAQQRAFKASLGMKKSKYGGKKKAYKKKYSQKVSSVFGHGKYQMGNFRVKSNTLSDGTSPPQFGSSHRITTIRHREFIQDIYSGTLSGTYTPFTIQTFPINPALAQTFPWLSSIAANYETYKIKGMMFEFKSMSADALNSTNTGLGTVVMATQYNAANANFISKQQMENYEFAQSCVPSTSMLHCIECAKYETPVTELYCRVGAVPSGQDQRLYDLGEFSIATVGMQATNVNLGELWVTYDIELFKPKLTQGEYGDEILYAHYTATSGVSTSAYFGTNGSFTLSTNMFPFTVGTTTLTLPLNIVAGNYLLTYRCTVSGSNNGPSIAATTNCTALQILNADATALFEAGTNSSPTAGSYFFFTVTGPGAVLTFSGATLPSATNLDVVITQIDGLAG